MKVNPGSNWAIAVACFFINMFVVGSSRIDPLLFVECLNRFNPDRSVSVFPFILNRMLSLGSGPFIAYFGQKFGVNRVIFSGCLLSAIGAALCSFAEDIVAVTMFWGVCYGIGLGIQYALLPAILNLNYRKNQTLANGFAMVGINLGGVIYPLLFEVLLRAYGLSGTFLILSAIIMNAIPACMIMKTRDISKPAAYESSNDDKNRTSKVVPNNHVKTRNIPTAKPTIIETCVERLNKGCVSNLRELSETTMQPLEKCDIISADSSTDDVFERNIVQKAQNTLLTISSGTCLGDDKDNKDISLACEGSLIAKNSDSLSKHITKSAAKQHSFPGSLRVFMDPVFLVICTSQSLFLYIIVIVRTILIDFMRDKGMPTTHETTFYVCFLLVDMAGRIIVGCVVDNGYITLIKYTALSGIVIGLALVASALVTNYLIVIGVVHILSLLFATTFVVFPGIIHNFIEPDYRNMALASRSLLFLPLNLTSSPLIGYFREKLGSYNGMFYTLSALSFLCCCLCFIVPSLARRRGHSKNTIQHCT